MKRPSERIGVVVIGRNEGTRLALCLDSVAGSERCVVYVDSGSSDNSVALARERGMTVVELEPNTPFTAARARNVGFDRLMELDSEVSVVQFVDGDCALMPGWLDSGSELLRSREEVWAVCGHCRERHPEASVYNTLCALEWKGGTGEIDFAGGILMVRAAAFRRVGGFDRRLIAGEDPEFSLRLRQAGGIVHRLDLDMCLHDAAMMRWSQWWRRAVRSGYAYAASRDWGTGRSTSPWAREIRSNWVWGALVPAAVIAIVLYLGATALLLLLAYPLLTTRIALHRRRQFREGWSESWLYATFCVVSKFPQALGQARFWLDRYRTLDAKLIEYKSVEASSADRAACAAGGRCAEPTAGDESADQERGRCTD